MLISALLKIDLTFLNENTEFVKTVGTKDNVDFNQIEKNNENFDHKIIENNLFYASTSGHVENYNFKNKKNFSKIKFTVKEKIVAMRFTDVFGNPNIFEGFFHEIYAIVVTLKRVLVIKMNNIKQTKIAEKTIQNDGIYVDAELISKSLLNAIVVVDDKGIVTVLSLFKLHCIFTSKIDFKFEKLKIFKNGDITAINEKTMKIFSIFFNEKNVRKKGPLTQHSQNTEIDIKKFSKIDIKNDFVDFDNVSDKIVSGRFFQNFKVAIKGLKEQLAEAISQEQENAKKLSELAGKTKTTAEKAKEMSSLAERIKNKFN
ncbi:hypothetical protein MHBO_002930 [Bonamia ostreae]|uniref:Uncharacterized protein n=1 Tax=Bonamia ostreae TaxID=126728 RepID=A0ABV2APE7_9EUKA